MASLAPWATMERVLEHVQQVVGEPGFRTVGNLGARVGTCLGTHPVSGF